MRPMAPDVARTTERELKLAVPAGFRLPELPGRPLVPTMFTSTYVDTADRRLSRARITLRRRVENGRSAWQLKLPQAGARLELEALGGPRAIPEGLAELLTGLVRGQPLDRLVTLRTRRSGIRVEEEGEPVADVVLDRVAVLEGRRVTSRFEELEIESVNGDTRALERLGAVLREAGAVARSGTPKALRVAPLPPAGTPSRTPGPEQERVAAVLREQVAELVARDPGTRLGVDPEELHGFRVATRRLRAALRSARPLLDRAWADELRGELAWLTRAAGPVRDLDVLIEQLEDERARLPDNERKSAGELVAALVAERATARERLLATLSDERYTRLLDRLEEAAAAPRWSGEATTLRELAAAEFRRLRKAAAGVDRRSPDADLHALRVRAKRARYTAELAGARDERKTATFVRRAKRFQDLIGEHQDAVVAEERLRRLAGASASPSAAFVAGRLAERQRARRAAARDAFPDAWRRLRRSGARAWA
jgi:CHAD domain-containing protein